MARKDVVKYFLQQQQIMDETMETSKEFDGLFALGKITPEQRDAAQREVDIVKANYMRIAYIMFLLNQPKRDDKKDVERKQNDKWYKALSGSSREAIFDESKDALADFKRIIREAKDER